MLHLREGANLETGWLAHFIRAAIEESENKRPGGESILSRLSELMFVEVVRRYLTSLPEDQTGWLAGLRDRNVGQALNLLHGQPAFAWDAGAACGRGRSFAFCVHRTIYTLCWCSTDALPCAVAHASRNWSID